MGKKLYTAWPKGRLRPFAMSARLPANALSALISNSLQPHLSVSELSVLRPPLAPPIRLVGRGRHGLNIVGYRTDAG